jgi:hypothetical protein
LWWERGKLRVQQGTPARTLTTEQERVKMGKKALLVTKGRPWSRTEEFATLTRAYEEGFEHTLELENTDELLVLLNEPLPEDCTLPNNSEQALIKALEVNGYEVTDIEYWVPHFTL